MLQLQKRCRFALLVLVVLFPICITEKSANAEVIYQAFNEPFDSIIPKLGDLSYLGVTYLQVSPPQKSIDQEIWWGRYQPVDFRVIEGPLGDGPSLSRLIQASHQHGIKVLVDAVLNHMADPVFYHSALHYPQFGPQDFHYVNERPCIENYNDRHQATKFWMCDPAFPDRRLPDLDTSSQYVRSVHKEYLRMLMNMGVDGFRFDGVKHIEADYFEDVLRVVPEGKFFYGEVISDTRQLSQEYLPQMPITDFQLLGVMIRAFGLGGRLDDLINPEAFGAALPGAKAVVFARNHDTAMASSFFNFADATDAKLGNAFVLGRGVGKVLIYRDDIQGAEVRKAMRFNRVMEGQSTNVRHLSEICDLSQSGCDPAGMLVMDRGDRGLVVINKRNEWIDLAAVRMPGLKVGCYKEMGLGFHFEVSRGRDGQKWISMWGSRARGGLEIGPRSSLFFRQVEGADRCPESSRG